MPINRWQLNGPERCGRRTVMKIAIVSLVLVFSLGACGGNVQPNTSGDTIETSAGEEFNLVIESNPSTGYHWEILGELDANIVEFVSKDYRAAEPVAPGSGGSDVWVFKAVGGGETTITLGYYPPSNEPAD